MNRFQKLWRYCLQFRKRRNSKRLHRKLQEAEALQKQAQSAVDHFVKFTSKRSSHLSNVAFKKLVERQFAAQLAEDHLKLKWGKSLAPKVVYA